MPATKPVRVDTMQTSSLMGSAQLMAPVCGRGKEGTAAAAAVAKAEKRGKTGLQVVYVWF
jgi:hypothetical protein